MQIEDLSDKAAVKLLKHLIKEMHIKSNVFAHDASEDDISSGAKQMLSAIVETLDDLDGDDYFGSDGWKHYFGLEDEF
jgi:hypothetical protein